MCSRRSSSEGSARGRFALRFARPHPRPIRASSPRRGRPARWPARPGWTRRGRGRGHLQGHRQGLHLGQPVLLRHVRPAAARHGFGRRQRQRLLCPRSPCHDLRRPVRPEDQQLRACRRLRRLLHAGHELPGRPDLRYRPGRLRRHAELRQLNEPSDLRRRRHAQRPRLYRRRDRLRRQDVRHRDEQLRAGGELRHLRHLPDLYGRRLYDGGRRNPLRGERQRAALLRRRLPEPDLPLPIGKRGRLLRSRGGLPATLLHRAVRLRVQRVRRRVLLRGAKSRRRSVRGRLRLRDRRVHLRRLPPAVRALPEPGPVGGAGRGRRPTPRAATCGRLPRSGPPPGDTHAGAGGVAVSAR
jgi:hypothetical protein